MKLRFCKSALLMGSVLAGGLFTACSPTEVNHTETVTYPSLNYAFSQKDDMSSLSMGAYTFYVNYSEKMESISTTSLVVDNTTYSFSTNGVPFEDISPSRGLGLYAEGFMANTGTPNELNDCKFYVGSMPIPDGSDYIPTKAWIPMTEPDENGKTDYHPGAMYRPGYNIPPIIVGNYKIGTKFEVITMSSDLSYFGTTNTTYTDGGFATNKLVYRIFLDIKSRKADVVMYNAQFAAKAPVLKVVYLQNLDFIADGSDFTIEGNGIVPKMAMGNSDKVVLIENPSYKFNTFKLQTVSGTLLTKANISYEVGESYKGSCEAAYINLPTKMME